MSNRAKFIAVVALIANLGLHAYFAWSVRRQLQSGYSDFTSFYGAGLIVRQGDAKHLYDYDTQWRIQQTFAPDVNIRQGPLPYVHAPFEALLFVPLSYLPFSGAYLAWNAINIGLLLLMYFVLRPNLPGLESLNWALWLAITLSFFPIFAAFLQGQDSILLLAIYAVVFCSLSRRREWLAGCSLGLALFKLHLVLPFMIVFVWRRNWKVLAGFGASALGLTAVSAALLGWSGFVHYPAYLQSYDSTYGTSSIWPQRMPNVRGLLESTLGGTLAIKTIIVASSTLLLYFAVRAWKGIVVGDDKRRALAFSANLTVTLLVGYHLIYHDLSILLLPMLLVANHLVCQTQVHRITKRMLIASTGALFLTPLYLFLMFAVENVSWMCLVVLLFLAGVLREARRLGPGEPAQIHTSVNATCAPSETLP
jgi:hypothetical protein